MFCGFIRYDLLEKNWQLDDNYGVALQVVFSWGPGSSSTMAVTYLATSQAFFSIQMASLSFTSVSTLHLWGHQRTWNTPIPFTSWHLILYVLMHLFSQPCFNCAECPEAWWFLLNTGPWWLYSCNFDISKTHFNVTYTDSRTCISGFEDVAADLGILIWSKPLR